MSDMTTLQLGLAGIGAAVLVAMAVQATWSSRKNQPRQPTPVDPATGPDTALPAGEGIEPELDAVAFDAAHFPRPTPEKKAPMDALIDVIAPIALEAVVSGDVALAAMPATRRVGSKPFSVEGLNHASAQWEVPHAGHHYTQFQTGVQLANRSGALNEIEYSEFVMKTQAFCDAVNGTPDFPEMREEVARARELDSFAGDHDAQLGFCLQARRAAWSPGYVEQNAARYGFVQGAIPGRMVLPASQLGLPPVLMLNFDTQAALADDPAQSAIRQLSLSLDVPQVQRSEQAFQRMRDMAVALAAEMDGVITDDSGIPLHIEALDQISAELDALYDTLEQRELGAGSALARRLFS